MPREGWRVEDKKHVAYPRSPCGADSIYAVSCTCICERQREFLMNHRPCAAAVSDMFFRAEAFYSFKRFFLPLVANQTSSGQLRNAQLTTATGLVPGGLTSRLREETIVVAIIGCQLDLEL